MPQQPAPSGNQGSISPLCTAETRSASTHMTGHLVAVATSYARPRNFALYREIRSGIICKYSTYLALLVPASICSIQLALPVPVASVATEMRVSRFERRTSARLNSHRLPISKLVSLHAAWPMHQALTWPGQSSSNQTTMPKAVRPRSARLAPDTLTWPSLGGTRPPNDSRFRWRISSERLASFPVHRQTAPIPDFAFSRPTS